MSGGHQLTQLTGWLQLDVHGSYTECLRVAVVALLLLWRCCSNTLLAPTACCTHRYGQALNYSMFSNVLLTAGSPAAGQGAAGRAAPASAAGVSGDTVGAAAGAEGAPGKALTPGQFAGVVVGALSCCVLMAGLVVARAMRQRRQAAAAATAAAGEAELLAAVDNSLHASQPGSRSPSVKGPSRSRAQSTSAAAAPAAAAAASGGSSGSSPERSASKSCAVSAVPLRCEGQLAVGGAADGVGVVSVADVQPCVVTRSGAKLGR